MSPGSITQLKLFYLIALAFIMFAFDQPAVIVGLLVVQLLFWLGSALPVAGIWTAIRRLRLFFLIIILSFAFIGTDNDQWHSIPIGPWAIKINLTSIQLALLMCLRVITLVIASNWVRLSSPKDAFVGGLRAIGLPELVALGIDATLDNLGGGGGRGKGDGGGRHRDKQPEQDNANSLTFAQIRSGDVTVATDWFARHFKKAREALADRYQDLPAATIHDLTIVLGVSLAIMSLKLLQILPGLPVAPGHKNILIIPLLLFAARATHGRFGATSTSMVAGIVSFMLGYGKYGILELAHFIVPGMLADVLTPLARATSRSGRLLQFILIGAVLGLGRFAANFLIIVLAGAPQIAFLLYLPILISQVTFGALSGFVSLVFPKDAKDLEKQNQG
ncbi:MAG: energy-coupling factor transporter transmembrane component T [Gammaproteobacteria bacterium]|nr:energy-coupling factor transporter transmembrane component T [Gammaproteobacteria bacterium]